MNKRILLVGYNFFPEPTGIGKYNTEMMQWLAKNDYDCTILTTYPYYPYWQVQPPYDKSKWLYSSELLSVAGGSPLRIHRVPMYVPAVPSGIKRILLDITFSATALLKLFRLFVNQKFDYVLVVAPSFQFGLLGALGKRIWKAKFIYHIQDMQIEAARDLGMIKSNKIINTLFNVERYIFDKADYISSISEGMVNRIAQKVHKKIIFFPNWADTSLIFPLPNRRELKILFGLNASAKVALYSGAIGEKQGLEAILIAAKEFEQESTVKFVICGSGPYSQSLQAQATAMQLTNVIFLPLQPLDRLNMLLNMADIHLVIQKANASDLVMPSKLTNILAVGGLALLTANEDSGLHELITRHQMGLLVPAENQVALNDGLRYALENDTSSYTTNARAYAEKYLDINEVMQRFTHEVLK